MSVKSLSEKGSESATGSPSDGFNTPEDKALVRKIDLQYDNLCCNSNYF